MRLPKKAFITLVFTAAFSFSSPSAHAQVVASDSLALVDLYNGLNGASWMEKWDLWAPVDTWYGVTVNWEVSGDGKLGRVSELNLDLNGLAGQIPESIGNLSTLRKIYLYGNQLDGAIPTSIWHISSLTELDLGDNRLTGSISASVGNLSNLKSLNLSKNLLVGAIPQSFANLSNILHLNIRENRLSGTVPEIFGNMSNLEVLDISFNQLSGSIPETVGNLTKVMSLDFGGNRLSGLVPLSIAGLKQMQFLYLFFNKFIFDDLESVAPKIHILDFAYINQDSIPVSYLNDALTVSVGATPANNSFRWYSADAVVDTTIYGDSSFIPQKSGNYFVEARNAVLPEFVLYGQVLVASLQSYFMCPNGTAVLQSTALGSSYQWQEKIGGDFVDLNEGGHYVGVSGPQLQLSIVSTSWYGRQYRCKVDGVYEGSVTLKFKNRWIGGTSGNWQLASNWSCGSIPDDNTDVVIDNGTVTITGNASCRSLTVKSESAQVNIAAGAVFTVAH